MPYYILDGSTMTTLETAYAEIARGLQFPDYFGKNLDALEECLRDKLAVEGLITIIVEPVAKVEVLPEWPQIRQVFEENGIQLELK